MQFQAASRPARGFTLFELMIVMVIIAILAAIAIPGTKSIIDRTRRAAAKNDALNLKNAIASYVTEYRRFPTRLNGPESGSAPILSDHALMDILLGSDAETGPGGLNPRRLVSFSGNPARPIGHGRYRSGVVLDDQGGGTLWDPWGNHYRVILDLDGDSRVPAPGFLPGPGLLPQTIVIWSPGKDGSDEESEDNVTTW